MQPDDLIAAARDLAAPGARGRPKQAYLRRATSTAYYALFHCLAENCADMLVGGPGSVRSRPAWNQTYRALQHGFARSRLERDDIRKFPAEIQDFAITFVAAQKMRHEADYNPHSRWDKDGVMQGIYEAESAIRRFRQVPAKDRRAFAIYVLLEFRNRG